MKKVCLLNLGHSNIKSVRGAFAAIDVETLVIEKIDSLEINAPLVLPGVGSFGDAMQRLTSDDTSYYLGEAYKKGHPILGICLGMQIMFEGSEEDIKINGLGFLPGHIRNLNQNIETFCHPSNIGYSCLHTSKIQDIGQYSKFDGEHFYFCHSYYFNCKNKEDIMTETEFSQKFPSIIKKDNIYGIQFHPEKSHDNGVKILENFSKL